MQETKPNSRSWVRRQYLINPRFQLRFIFYSLAASVATVFAMFLMINIFFSHFAAKGDAIGLSPDHIFYVFLSQQQDFMNWLLAIFSLFLVVGLTVWGLILSHRIAGPLHRLHVHMNSVARGEVRDSLHFRRNDYFQELAESYNAQYQQLRQNAEDRQVSQEKPAHSKSKAS